MVGQRAVRSLRAFALAAFVAAFVATHWPALELKPQMPGDKLLHAVTFAALTFLLWRSRVIPSLGWLVTAMLLYAAFDELTQSIPWIRRHASLADFISDAAGVAIAAMAIATVPRPVGELGRMHRELTDAADGMLLDRPANWMAIGSAAALGALVGGPLCATLARVALLDRSPGQSLFLGAVVFAAAGAHMAWLMGLRHWMRRIRRERLCLRCGKAQTPTEGDAAGTCAGCGARWTLMQWIEPSDAYSARRPIPWRRIALVAAVAVAVTALVAWPLLAVARWMDVGTASGQRADVSRGLTAIMVYLIGLMPLLALARFARQEWMRTIASGDRSCVACGHDLTRTADTAGCGRCPECGCAFARPAAADQP
ncbi:MAG: hypothetical protein FGM37_08665 [Phycisphaerales bacterium]|nr:hypothetical protein [Phycisphaerales bacterium]